MNRTLSVGALCALLLVSLSACDSSGDGGREIPSQIGTYTATVSGDEEGELSGGAFSSSAAGAWVLVFSETFMKSGLDNSFTFTRTLGGRPGEGTYQIIPEPEDETTNFITLITFNGTVYFGATGHVDITSSASSNVKGTFEVTATSGAGATITIEGAFNSLNVDAGS